MKDLIHIDLFSGAGGFHKGLFEAGFTFSHHYFSEIDKHAIANYKYNFPNSIYAGDIRIISGTELRKRHPNARFIITFGFPCQDLSVAGKGAGFDGERSVLFFEAIRIIKEIEPEVFIFENVKGLLSHNGGKTFTTILRTIADIGLYLGEWQLLNTAWVLPQNRERIYFVGHLRGKSKPRVFPITENDFRTSKRSTETTVNTLTAGGHSGGMHSSMTLICDSGQCRKLEEREILPPLRANTGVGHGNYIAQRGRGKNNGGDHEVCPTISSKSFEHNNHVITIANTVTPDAYLATGKRKRDEDGNAVLTSMCERRIRRLTEIECERLQGFTDNWTKYGNYDGIVKEISKTQRYKLMGNAVTTKIVKLVGSNLITNNCDN